MQFIVNHFHWSKQQFFPWQIPRSPGQVGGFLERNQRPEDNIKQDRMNVEGPRWQTDGRLGRCSRCIPVEKSEKKKKTVMPPHLLSKLMVSLNGAILFLPPTKQFVRTKPFSDRLNLSYIS